MAAKTHGMNERSASRSAIGFELTFFLFASLAAYHYAELRFALNSWIEAASPQALMRGEAQTPFQYRLLVPALTRALHEVYAWAGRTPQVARLYFGLELTACLGAVYGLRHYLRVVGASREAGSVGALLLIPALAFSFLLPRMQPLFFPWDTPGVMFFALGAALLHRRRWSLFYPLFFAATLNRETSCFLTLLYLFGAWKETPLKTLFTHCSAQLLIWMALKITLRFCFSDNGGAGLFEVHHQGQTGSHLASNLAFLGRWRSYPLLLSCYAYLWIPVVWRHRDIPDPFVRRSLWVFVPFFLGMLVVANIFEVRIFGELFPLIAAALVSLGLSFGGAKGRVNNTTAV